MDPGPQQTLQIQAPSRNQFKGFIIHSGIREVNGPARCAHEPWGYTAVRSTFGASSPRSTAKAPAMLFGTDIWSQPIVLVPGGPLPFCTRCRVQHEPRTQMHLWRCYHCIHCGVVMCGECYLPHIWHLASWTSAQRLQAGRVFVLLFLICFGSIVCCPCHRTFTSRCLCGFSCCRSVCSTGRSVSLLGAGGSDYVS